MCACWVVHSCPTLCDPVGCSPPRLLCPQNFPSDNTGVSCHFLLQGIFLIQGLTRVSSISCCDRLILYYATVNLILAQKNKCAGLWVCHFNLHLKLFLSGEFEKLSQKRQFFTCSILGVKKCCWMYFEVWSQDWDRRHFSSVFRRVCKGTLWGHEGSMQPRSMPSFLGGWEEQQKQWWPILLDTISYSLVWRHWVTLSIIWVSAVRTPMVTGSKYEVPKVTPVLLPCGLITLIGGICWRPRLHSIPSFYLMNLKPLLPHTKPILA